MSELRLSKLMSMRGLCSRREADQFIQRGWVRVDGQPVTLLGTKVQPSQTISLAAAARQQQQHLVTVLLNKPRGYVAAQPERGYPAAVMLICGANRHHRTERIPQRHGLAAAGRLDIDSVGLMVFSQDGRIAKQLIAADSDIEKEYLVTVNGHITPAKLAQLQHGLHLDGHALKPATVDQRAVNQLGFILKQGRKRQIRRMCELVDLHVSHLQRIRIGRVELGRLPLGKWRLLGRQETFG